MSTHVSGSLFCVYLCFVPFSFCLDLEYYFCLYLFLPCLFIYHSLSIYASISGSTFVSVSVHTSDFYIPKLVSLFLTLSAFVPYFLPLSQLLFLSLYLTLQLSCHALPISAQISASFASTYFNLQFYVYFISPSFSHCLLPFVIISYYLYSWCWLNTSFVAWPPFLLSLIFHATFFLMCNGQSYKHFTIVNYDSRVVIWANLLSVRLYSHTLWS